MIDTKELRRLAQEATPGPWTSSGRYIGTPRHMSYIGEAVDQCGNWSDTKKSIGDAKFIAAANPAAITELLDRLERAESECLEQARLNGMGSEREAALMAKLEAAEKERDWNAERLEDAIEELTALRAELETERMRLTACGVVAMSNTTDSAKQARDMSQEYWSASCVEVARMVDENIKLRAKIEQMEKQAPAGVAGSMPGAPGFTMACFSTDEVPVGTKLYALYGTKGE